MEKDWQDAIVSFYREVDKEIERLARADDVVCASCGDCCYFDTAGHLLYASTLERRYLRLVSTPAPNPDASADLLAAGVRCPYQQDNTCHARSGRVLGCRLHFCQWRDPAVAEEVAERWHFRLKRVHDALGEAWEYRRLFPLDENEQ